MSDANDMVREAIKTYKAGKKRQAHALLIKATEVDPNNEKAWMWLSAVVDSVEDQRICLENVLILNPDNTAAQRGLKSLEGKSDPPAAKPDPVPDPPATGPFTIDDADDEYYVPTSSASAVYDPASQISGDELDDWISQSGIGGGAAPAATTQTDYTSGPFTSGSNDAYSDLFDNEFDDQIEDEARFDSQDIYGGDVFTPNYGGDGNLTEDDLRQDLFSQDTFGSDYDDDPIEIGSDDFNADSLFISDDDPFAEYDQKPPSSASRQEIMDEAAAANRKRDKRKSSNNKRRTGSRQRDTRSGAFVDDGESLRADNTDPGVYFSMIPEEIKATRIPGKRDGGGLSMLLITLLLLIANAGAMMALMTG